MKILEQNQKISETKMSIKTDHAMTEGSEGREEEAERLHFQKVQFYLVS